MASAAKSGIQTTADGNSVIPASKRADGSTRKEIKVRPGYRPPEDVETYKNRTAEAWKTRGSGGVPGADSATKATESESKSKNAKRREAARRKANAAAEEESDLSANLVKAAIDENDSRQHLPDRGPSAIDGDGLTGEDAEQQKKVRNALKKLKAVRDLKDKKSSGEKLSHDQLLKMSKESELVRDLERLGYHGPEINEKG